MKALGKMFPAIFLLILAVGLTGCAVGPAGPYYQVAENHAPAGGGGFLKLGPDDQYYTLRIEDRTPFGLRHLPQTQDMLYQKGYDQVRKDREADFSVDVIFSAGVQDNPNVRAGNTVGGALVGAATGAIIGGAFREPGAGAAIGAAGGAAIGLAAPAGTALVRIDLTVHSLTDRQDSQRSVTVDLSTVPPHDVAYVIDNEVSRLLQGLPRR